MDLLGNLAAETFFAEYWHQQPAVLRSGLNVGPPIGWGKLKALAERDNIESRWVLERGGTYPWEVRHGPFEVGELDRLDPRGAGQGSPWSLLVHEVDAHVERAAAVLRRMDFLPRWQVDDVMVSFAPPGGSVGPHIDRYDAFLMQSLGRRRWQLEDIPRSRADIVHLDGPDLAILASFEPTAEYVLEPGDVLYVPPGVAHFGVAIDPAETWSIGLRAPSVHELVAAFVEDALDSVSPDLLYQDPEPHRSGNSGEITRRNIAEIRDLLDDVLRTDELDHWVGQFLTTSWRDTGEPNGANGAGGFGPAVAAGAIRLRPGVRRAYVECDDGSIQLFVEGRVYPLPQAAAGVARGLANQGSFSAAQLASPTHDQPSQTIGPHLPERSGEWLTHLYTDLRRHGFLVE